MSKLNLGKKIYNLFFEEDPMIESSDLKRGIVENFDDTDALIADAANESQPTEKPKVQAVSTLLSEEVPAFEKTLETTDEEGNTTDIDFEKVFEVAKIESPTFSVEKALDMIEKLPSAMPLDDKRSSVRVVLSATGIKIADVLKNAAEKVRALEAYVDVGEKELAELEAETNHAIELLEKEIESYKTKLQQKKIAQNNLEMACEIRAKQFESVVDFFTLDDTPSESETMEQQ